MKNNILQLAKEFIAIPSTEGNKEALDKIVTLVVTHLQGFTIEQFTKDGVKSMLVYNTPKRPKKFKIILNGHLDVIPGKASQYQPHVVGDKLCGIGAMDMKANVACMLFAFKEVAKKITYPLALQLVTDEQSGGTNGTKYQIEQGVRAEFVISGETTNFAIVNKAKGVLWLHITFTGKSAHGAYPWQGENALLKAHKFVNALLTLYPLPSKAIWGTTINISKIETSNTVFNKIPDEAILSLDIRYTSESKRMILNKIKDLLPKASKLNIILDNSPIFVNEDNKYLQLLRKSASGVLHHKIRLQSAHGTSDMTHYAEVGCVGVEFGAIGMKGNTSREYIRISSLESYDLVLIKFLLELNKKGEDE